MTIRSLLTIAIIYIVLSIVFTDKVSADVPVAEGSAQLKIGYFENSFDPRAMRLKNYLENHHSPLSEYADEFVLLADKHNLDWRLVAAISGVESTFGKNLPRNSYNAYGWANGRYFFKSWEEGIEIVSKALREKYVDKGADSIYEIGRIYAPPSRSWAWKVEYFMGEIDRIPVEFDI